MTELTTTDLPRPPYRNPAAVYLAGLLEAQ